VLFEAIILDGLSLTTLRIQYIYLLFLNRRHAKKRESLGKSAVVLDRSMQKIKILDLDSKADGLPPVNAEEHVFDDKTDWDNEDFVYVY